MSYQEMNDLYRDDKQRGRMGACIRQQALIFSADGRADIAALGNAIVGGSAEDIDAVIAAVSTGPNWDTVDEDQALLSAVQSVWPAVAAARHGG